jgi:membrane protein YqaA with SNARE-associated domain
MIEVLSDPQIWFLILVISLIGAIARLANYSLGLHGKDKIESLYPKIKPETWDRLLISYERLGILPLLVSSIPIIGTLLTIGAGMAGINRTWFLIMVTVSKIIRNWILVLLIWYLL